MASALERFRVLGTALESSPVSVVITDGEGRIDWVNSGHERNTAFARRGAGQKPSLVASGQTPAQTYQPAWPALLSWQLAR